MYVLDKLLSLDVTHTVDTGDTVTVGDSVSHVVLSYPIVGVQFP